MSQTMKEGLLWVLRGFDSLVALLPSNLSIVAFPAGQDKVRPFVTIRRIASIPQATHSAPRNYKVERWQFDAYADSDQEAEFIGDEIEELLDVTGPMDTRTYKIYSSNVLSTDDDIEMDDDSTQEYAGRKTVQIQIKRARKL